MINVTMQFLTKPEKVDRNLRKYSVESYERALKRIDNIINSSENKDYSLYHIYAMTTETGKNSCFFQSLKGSIGIVKEIIPYYYDGYGAVRVELEQAAFDYMIENGGIEAFRIGFGYLASSKYYPFEIHKIICMNLFTKDAHPIYTYDSDAPHTKFSFYDKLKL